MLEQDWHSFAPFDPRQPTRRDALEGAPDAGDSPLAQHCRQHCRQRHRQPPPAPPYGAARLLSWPRLWLRIGGAVAHRKPDALALQRLVHYPERCRHEGTVADGRGPEARSAVPRRSGARAAPQWRNPSHWPGHLLGRWPQAGRCGCPAAGWSAHRPVQLRTPRGDPEHVDALAGRRHALSRVLCLRALRPVESAA